MQYSAMDQTLDTINEFCLCSRRSLIHEICSYDISRVEKRYFALPRSAYYHRRRNQGGTGGTCPPQPARKGASAPTVTAMPVHAVIGLTMKYHIEFRK